jgi:hypothetical protein
MATYSIPTPDRRWACGVLVGLLIGLTASTNAWSRRPQGEAMHVAVHGGQLSVDLHEAPVRGVLAAIGRQAGVRIAVKTSADRTVNARFTDLALDQGLRRLLRAASLNFSLVYARDSDTTDSLREVHVFGEGGDRAAPSHDRPRRERVSRTAAVRNPPPQEAPGEAELPGELGPDAELEPSEPEDEALLE